MNRQNDAYLDSLLVVLDVIPVNVVVGTHWLLQLRSNDVTRAFRSGTAGENHDAPTSVLEGCLEQANSNTQSHTSASEGSLVIRNGPRISLQLFEYIGDLELGLLNG
jgi:hypothetical protein